MNRPYIFGIALTSIKLTWGVHGLNLPLSCYWMYKILDQTEFKIKQFNKIRTAIHP